MKLKPPRLPKLKIPDILIDRPLMMWFVGMSSIVAAIEIAFGYGVIQHIYASDVTKLSVFIVCILFWQSISCGAELWNQSQSSSVPDTSKRIVERGWLWSDIVLSLGMIGTVIGFMMMLGGFADVDFSDVDSVQGLISQLSAGMATSLSTTLVGLIVSVILKLQFFTLESVIDDKKEKWEIL